MIIIYPAGILGHLMNDCKSYWIYLSKRQRYCVSTKEQKRTGIALIIKNSTEDFSKERKKEKKIHQNLT